MANAGGITWMDRFPRGAVSTPFTLAALLLALSSAGALSAAQAAVLGAAPAKPMPEAVAASRRAAQAVLARQGRPSCLIGKLTNALLGLSSSCEASGERSPLCALADHAAVTTRWSMDFTDATARSVLELSGAGWPTAAAGGSPSATTAEFEAATP